MRLASVFLSHSSQDAALVEAVNRELGRRGVVGWLDRQRLVPGQSLRERLEQAIREQTLVAVFITRVALQDSRWVDLELNVALDIAEQDPGAREWIVPVFLEPPMPLVANHRRLKETWRDRDGHGLDLLYVQAEISSGQSPEEQAAWIAGELARAVYARLKLRSERELAIQIDQRGSDRRMGAPTGIPRWLEHSNLPLLVFRQDDDQRRDFITLHGGIWQAEVGIMQHALRTALGDLRSHDRRVRLLGNGQHGLFFARGSIFDRTNRVTLSADNPRDGNTFDNEAQPPLGPLTGGDPHSEQAHPRITPLEPRQRYERVSLILAAVPSPDVASVSPTVKGGPISTLATATPTALNHRSYVEDVLDWLELHPEAGPPVWIPTRHYTDSAQVMGTLRDVSAVLGRLREEHRTRDVDIFGSIPVVMAALLAASLPHVVSGEVRWMEWRKDLKNAAAGDRYEPLPMPGTIGSLGAG